MNKILHQQNYVCFKGVKNQHKAHAMPSYICFGNHVSRISNTHLLFIIELFQKA